MATLFALVAFGACGALWDPWLAWRQSPCMTGSASCPAGQACDMDALRCDPMDLSLQSPPMDTLQHAVDLPPSDLLNPYACKAFGLFNPSVKDKLVTCADTCHSPGRNNVATGAFNMAAALSSDTAELQSFCFNALARVNLTDPPSSLLIKQVTPAVDGGTPNHPYKMTDSAALTSFKNAVTTWAASER